MSLTSSKNREGLCVAALECKGEVVCILNKNEGICTLLFYSSAELMIGSVLSCIPVSSVCLPILQCGGGEARLRHGGRLRVGLDSLFTSICCPFALLQGLEIC